MTVFSVARPHASSSCYFTCVPKIYSSKFNLVLISESFLSSRYHFTDSASNKLAIKLTDNWINGPINVTDLPQLHDIPHRCLSFCFYSYLTMLCCVRYCRATEHIMLSTTAMPFAEILHCCYSLSHSVSCLLEIPCCDCCGLWIVTVCKSWMLFCSVTLHGY